MQSTLKAVVSERWSSADRIVSFTMASKDGSRLPHWEAGAHIDVQVLDDSGRPVTRQYSLCGAANAETWTIAVLDEPDGRGGAAWLHRHAHIGSELTVSKPRNHFPLHDGEAPAILVAGGIGITPILAMAHSLRARGTPFSLHYFARSKESAAFTDEILHGTLRDVSEVILDDESDRAGFPLSDRLQCTVTSESHLYVCGPAGFMDAVSAALLSRGLSPQRVHRELFSIAGLAREPQQDSTFEIQLRSDGRVIQVDAGRSAVQALADAGVNVVVSCEQGLCGSCLTTVLEGTPDHRDQFLLTEDRERNDCFTPCCSRALSKRLVLDL